MFATWAGRTFSSSIRSSQTNREAGRPYDRDCLRHPRVTVDQHGLRVAGSGRAGRASIWRPLSMDFHRWPSTGASESQHLAEPEDPRSGYLLLECPPLRSLPDLPEPGTRSPLRCTVPERHRSPFRSSGRLNCFGTDHSSRNPESQHSYSPAKKRPEEADLRTSLKASAQDPRETKVPLLRCIGECVIF